MEGGDKSLSISICTIKSIKVCFLGMPYEHIYVQSNQSFMRGVGLLNPFRVREKCSKIFSEIYKTSM